MITDLLRKLARVAWFLPGFLLWAAYPPMGEKTDVLFALAPLMWLSRRGDARESAKRWFQNGAFYWVATLSWMPAIVKNGGPWPLVVLGWFALAAYCAGYFALFGWLSAKVWRWTRDGGYGRRLFAVFLAEPLLWCGLELLRSRLFGGFSWNQLGVVPANGGFGAPAAIGGVYLLSAVVILINGTVAGIAERVMRQVPRLAGIETLLATCCVFGVYWASSFVSLPDPAHARQIKVALVQRNFPCVFKGREANPYEIYSKLLESAAALKPDLVILPESGLCEFGPVDQQGAVRFADWVKEKTGASLLTGGTRFSDGREYNSAALYSGGDIRVYDKVHLVPFGEFIPGDKWITALQKLAPVGSCTPGELKTLPVDQSDDGARLGVAICYEDTDSAQMRALAKMGAGMLVFITNDSWFSRSIEAEQHAWQATARAIETGLPVVRVGNNGVTGTIAPDGKVSWLPGPDGRPLVDAQGSMLDRIALAPVLGEDSGCRGALTPYVAFGDWPLCVTFALLILAMILVKYAHRHEKRRYLSM
ncbi:MAG: apolipoprotein N-acyltransferase [Kiritimatiellae bacterium]|nr:apolipoprotein N-acyltransferase [Kiritimatiellia bacterium]